MAAISQMTVSIAFYWMIKISLKFVPKVRINNIPGLVQIMAWCRPGTTPLTEPMMVVLPSESCVTGSQWVNPYISGTARVHPEHCCCWWLGAKAPGHQYPHCWLNIHYIGPVPYSNTALIRNNIRKWNYILEIFFWKIPSYFDGLGQDCSNSIANALELLQSCTKPSI